MTQTGNHEMQMHAQCMSHACYRVICNMQCIRCLQDQHGTTEDASQDEVAVGALQRALNRCVSYLMA